jgi:hypothetical protein
MLNQQLGSNCLSDWTFDRWYAGELSEPEALVLEQHLAQCEHCRHRQKALNTSAKAFLARYPLPDFSANAPVVLQKTRQTIRQSVAPIVVGLAAAASLVLLLRFGAQLAPDTHSSRAKGASHLGFYVKRAHKVIDGNDNMIVYPLDRLRFNITTTQPSHVAVLSRDGAGTVTEYYPGDGRSRAFGTVKAQPLETSVELDATLGPETLLGIFCKQPFTLEPLRKALAIQGQLPSLPDCSVDTLRIEKKNRP